MADGHSRGTRKDYAYFVAIARVSLMETETYVMIAERLGFATHGSTLEVLERISELGRMLTALRQRLIEPARMNTTREPRHHPITYNLYPITNVSMTIRTWLDNAIQDADRRGLGSLRPLLETLARSTSALRTADWNHDASGESGGPADVLAEADSGRAPDGL